MYSIDVSTKYYCSRSLRIRAIARYIYLAWKIAGRPVSSFHLKESNISDHRSGRTRQHMVPFGIGKREKSLHSNEKHPCASYDINRVNWKANETQGKWYNKYWVLVVVRRYCAYFIYMCTQRSNCKRKTKRNKVRKEKIILLPNRHAIMFLPIDNLNMKIKGIHIRY